MYREDNFLIIEIHRWVLQIIYYSFEKYMALTLITNPLNCFNAGVLSPAIMRIWLTKSLAYSHDP